MFRKKARRRSLKGYEGANLLVFLFVMVALGVFVSWVFQYYKSAGERAPSTSDDHKGIVSEALAPGSDVGIFYLDTNVSPTTRQYQNRLEIPPTDDGLVQGLFDITGVVGVVVDQKLIMIQKSPSVRWEAIRPAAREVISNHLHMHH